MMKQIGSAVEIHSTTKTKMPVNGLLYRAVKGETEHVGFVMPGDRLRFLILASLGGPKLLSPAPHWNNVRHYNYFIPYPDYVTVTFYND